MIVIVLHSTEEIKIIKYCKQQIDFFADNGIISYQSIPLWIPVLDSEYDKPQLKTFSTQIEKIEIQMPIFSENKLVCPVTIFTKNEHISTELKLLTFLSDSKNLKLKNKAASDIFPMQLKIFRIANAIEISPNAKALSDFVWKKIIS